MFIFTATFTRPDNGLEVLSAFVSDMIDMLTLLEGDCGLSSQVPAEFSELHEVKNKNVVMFHGFTTVANLMLTATDSPQLDADPDSTICHSCQCPLQAHNSPLGMAGKS